MENKINIAELLKDCPSGMELDCTMYDGCIFNRLVEYEHLYPIKVQTPDGQISLNKYGCYSCSEHAKCIIFPKGKTTWEGFHRPFKDGDVLFVQSAYSWILIYKESENKEDLYKYVAIPDPPYRTFMVYDSKPICYKGDISKIRFATEAEKQKLFDAIKVNGYKWNAETKTLEKLIEPKFKVGDMIQDENGYKVKITEVNIEDECYGYESIIAKGIGGIPFKEQNNWELAPNKFDIATLKPFDKVLVRVCDTDKWFGDFYMRYDDTDTEKEFPYNCVGGIWSYCIPYEENQHLLGSTNDCDEYYKTWE